jgi:hypothetical protein
LTPHPRIFNKFPFPLLREEKEIPLVQVERKIKVLLFLFFVSLYLLFMGNHFETPFYSIDEEILILTARSILEDFSLQIPDTYGMTVSRYGILPSVLVIPWYLLGRTIGLMFSPGMAGFFSIFFCYSMNAFVTALLLVYFYAFSRFLKYPRKTALYSTLVLGLCTILFPFARFFFSAPLVSLTLLASLYHFVKYARRKKTAEILLSSTWFSLLLLTRIDGISLLPVFVFGLICIHSGKKEPTTRTPVSAILKSGVYFSIPVLVALLGHCFLNYLKYGSFLSSGYGNEAFTTNLVYGLYGLLFSSGRGFFIYSPPMILALFCMARFWKKHPLAAALIVFAALVRLFLFAKWWGWHGGLSWGPRYIIPLVPIIGLMMNEPLLRFRKFSTGIRILIIALVIVGFLIQITAVLVSPTKTNTNMHPLVFSDENQFIFIPQISPITGNINMIRMGVIDTFIFGFAKRFNPVWLFFILVFLFGIALLSFRSLAKYAKCRFNDMIVLKSPKTFNASERLAAILIILNIIVFSLCHIGVSSNRIPRSTKVSYENGAEEYFDDFDTLVCLEETGIPKQGGSGIKAKDVRMKWSGYIHLPLNGEYHFYVKTRGKCLLWINEQVICSNTEDGAQMTIPSKAELQGGYYKFYAEYFPSDLENRVFHIYATYPGFGFYKTLLSNRNIFAEMPSLFQRGVLFLDNLKIFLVIFSIMIWVLFRRTAGLRSS